MKLFDWLLGCVQAQRRIFRKNRARYIVTLFCKKHNQQNSQGGSTGIRNVRLIRATDLIVFFFWFVLVTLQCILNDSCTLMNWKRVSVPDAQEHFWHLKHRVRLSLMDHGLQTGRCPSLFYLQWCGVSVYFELPKGACCGSAVGEFFFLGTEEGVFAFWWSRQRDVRVEMIDFLNTLWLWYWHLSWSLWEVL